jgi:LysM repeat protein
MSFISNVAPAAQKVGSQYNILPSLILAQACLESNYGKSGLAVNGNNLFGIKGKYQGQSVSMQTKEYVNGKWVTITSHFRKYPSWLESFEDHALLFTNGVSWDRAKYHNLIGETDYHKACENVRADGYATDPNYSSKLISIIEEYNLSQYDKESVVAPPAPPQPIHQNNAYTVKPGDSLSKILGTSNPDRIKEVCERNGISNPDKIVVGQQIVLEGIAPAAKPSGYTGNSVVDYLKSIHWDSSFGNRSKLAAQHGIVGYKGTPGQNLELLKKLRG